MIYSIFLLDYAIFYVRIFTKNIYTNLYIFLIFWFILHFSFNLYFLKKLYRLGDSNAFTIEIFCYNFLKLWFLAKFRIEITFLYHDNFGDFQ